jgi:hypothetical protein
LQFDIAILTPNGILFAMYICRNTEIAGAATDSAPSIPIQQAHDCLGHPGEDMTQMMAKELGWKLSPGNLKPCDACAGRKAKQKKVPKVSSHEVATAGEARVFLDIATVKGPEKGPNVTIPNWRIIVDERTQLKFSDFFETKRGMAEPTCELFHRWKNAGREVQFLRMNNAGENLLLQQRCESADWKFNIKCEFTAAMTPQQNHLAELGFAILANRGRALMARANVPMVIRYKIWREAFRTATMLDGLTVATTDGQTGTLYVLWCGENPKFAQHLRTWGEAGTVKTKVKGAPSRIADRGIQCMMTGYATDHEGDCYRMWDPKTKGIHETRDVIWMKRMYYEKDIGQGIIVPPMIINGIDDPTPATTPEAPTQEGPDTGTASVLTREGEDHDKLDNTTVPANAETARTRSGRTISPPERLIQEIGAIAAAVATAAANYEIALTASEIQYYATMKELGENAGEINCVGAGLGGGFEHTSELHVMKYGEAMQTKDKGNWEIGVKEEHEQFLKHNVFHATQREDVPKGNTTLTSTWVMKKKASGIFRARLNARGYEQVAGKHYDPDSIAPPVTSDTTIRIVMTLLLMASWCGGFLDLCTERSFTENLKQAKHCL